MSNARLHRLLREEGQATTLNSMRVRGRVGDTVFQATYGPLANAGRPGDRRLQIRSYVVVPNNKTRPQLIQQAKVRAAVTAWQELTPSEKDFYRITKRGNMIYKQGRGLIEYETGYTFFISQHVKGSIR